MSASLIPVGPNVPPTLAAILKSHQDAIRGLQNPQAPVKLPSVALKTDLTRFAADDFKECALVCDEINSICVSTLVAGNYAWKRADGSAI